MSNKTECVVCMKEINVMDKFNGEPMCQECYHTEENYVFGNDGDDADE